MAEPVVTLRTLTSEDLDTVVRWSRDPTFCLANGWDVGRAAAEVRRHWSRLLAEPPRGLLRLGAEVDGELVGYADLADIDETQAAAEAELGFAIGDSRRWGAGLGTATARAMVTHGFEQLRLRRIRATVHETNRRSVAVLEKLGFRRVADDSPLTEEYLGEPTTVLELVLDR